MLIKTAGQPQMGGTRLNKYPPKHAHTHNAAKRCRPGTRWRQPVSPGTLHNPLSVTAPKPFHRMCTQCMKVTDTLSIHAKFTIFQAGTTIEAADNNGSLAVRTIKEITERKYKIQIVPSILEIKMNRNHFVEQLKLILACLRFLWNTSYWTTPLHHDLQHWEAF